MGTFDSVIVGDPTVYVKAYAASNDPVSGNAATWTNWTELDVKTNEGVKISLTRAGEEITIDELEGAIDDVRTAEGGTVDLDLEQFDIELLAYGLAGAYAAGETPGTNEDTFKIGGATDANYSIGIECEDNAGLTHVIFFPKCKPVGPLETGVGKTKKAMTTYRWKLLKDPSRTAGETLAVIYRLTEAA